MDPVFRFDADYDAALVRHSAWRFARRRFGGDRRLWIAFAAGEVFCWAWAWWFGEPWMMAAGLALPVLVVALFVAVWLSHRAAAERKMRALDAGRASFTFDPDGLTVASRAASTTFAWAAIDDVWIDADFWIVVLAVNSYFTIPTAAAPPGALSFALARIEAAGPKRRDRSA